MMTVLLTDGEFTGKIKTLKGLDYPVRPEIELEEGDEDDSVG